MCVLLLGCAGGVVTFIRYQSFFRDASPAADQFSEKDNIFRNIIPVVRTMFFNE